MIIQFVTDCLSHSAEFNKKKYKSHDVHTVSHYHFDFYIIRAQK